MRATLDSLVAQMDESLEIIVIDDGSTDDTIRILESYDYLPFLRVIRGDRTGNWVANSNTGLSVARGRYVSFLHQDDIWLPNRLRTLKPMVERTNEPALLLHPCWFIDRRGRRIGLWRCPLPDTDQPLNPKQVVTPLLVQNFIAMPAPMFSRQLALDVGGLDEALWYTADWDFWLKLAARAATYYMPEPLAAFRIHPQSQTVKRSASSAEFRWQLDAVLERHLKTWCGGPGGTLLSAVAHYSVHVNTELSGYTRGRNVDWIGLLRGFLSLGPVGWRTYLRDSRILERVVARYRANLD